VEGGVKRVTGPKSLLAKGEATTAHNVERKARGRSENNMFEGGMHDQFRTLHLSLYMWTPNHEQELDQDP
jgi:hypothetical protein